MNLNKFDLIFWDFDGVIKDSVSVKTEVFEKIFSPYGQKVINAVRRHHEANGGVSRFDKIPLYLRWAGVEVTEERVARCCDLFSESVMQSVIDSPWVPGVREWLLNNYEKKHFVLVTATPQHEMEQILIALHIDKCFQSVFGAPVKKEKAIRSVLKKENVLPDSALMIGDSVTDLLAANANAVPFLLRRTDLNVDLQARYDGLQFDDLSYE